MATDGPTPAPCDEEIFLYGTPVAALSGSANAIEQWVREVAKQADARLDWHYSGGRAQVLHLGDEASRVRAVNMMILLLPYLRGQFLMFFGEGEGLWRNTQNIEGG